MSSEATRDSAFRLLERGAFRVLEPTWPGWPGLRAGLVTRQWRPDPQGEWQQDCSFRGAEGIASSAPFPHFQPEIGAGMRCARQTQVHGTTLVQLAAGNAPDVLHVGESDALLAATPGWLCLGQSADCCLGLVALPERRIAALFHAGWRGAVAGLPERVMATLTDLGAQPAECWIAICPAIQQASYQIGPEVARQVRLWATQLELPEVLRPDPERADRWRLDLPGLVAGQLRAAGVQSEQIFVSNRDTCEEPDWFHSYRREGAGMGLHVGYIGWED